MDKTICVGFVIFIDYFAESEGFKKFFKEKIVVGLFIFAGKKPYGDEGVRVVKTGSHELLVVGKEFYGFAGGYIVRNVGEFIAEHP